MGTGEGRQCDAGLTPEEGGRQGSGIWLQESWTTAQVQKMFSEASGESSRQLHVKEARCLAEISLLLSINCVQSLAGAVSQLHTP